MKKTASSLKAGLSAAANAPRRGGARSAVTNEKPVMIGGLFPRHVQLAIAQLRAMPVNQGKTVKEILGEGLNLVCERYGKPAPCPEK